MSIVVCKLPKAGLGNQLFPLMKAHTFGYLNSFPVVVTGYHQVKWGPYVRREKIKRKYSGFFTFQKNWFSAQWDKWTLKKYSSHQVDEPAVTKLNGNEQPGTMYMYSAMPHWDHYFDGLKENRALVIELFWRLISPEIKVKIAAQPSPCIGVHIRMGDFRKLGRGEDFSKVGIVRTPEEYFIDTIQSIRRIHGTELPVSVFTDGFRHEFEQLFTLNNITLIAGNNDLVDLVLLCKSKVIVTSATSTFSYWAGFLSDGVVIMHPAHVNTVIRSNNSAGDFYEGELDIANEILVKRIREIKCNG